MKGGFVFRARILFVVLLLLFFGSATALAYEGVRSGSWEKVIISPTKEFVSALGKVIESSGKNSPVSKVDVNNSFSFSATSGATSSSSINIKTITPTPSGNRGSSSYGSGTTIYITPGVSENNSQSSEDAQRVQDEWWAKVQAENEQKSLDSKNALEQFKAESQRKMADFDRQVQQGLEDFRNQYGF